MKISDFKAYHGIQSSLISFTSEYYLYFVNWEKNPTRFPSYANIWVITPEDKRILFADPPASREIAMVYHEFHEIYGGEISHAWLSENHLQVDCVSDEGEYELSLDLHLHETLSSRLLAVLASSRPTRFMLSKPMVALSNFLVNSLVTGGGVTVLGKTETGQTFYTGAVNQMMPINQGSAVLNGEDLGDVSRPTWPVEFGDVIPPVRPVIRVGTLYLPYDEEMLRVNDSRI